jgi:hypothetical protein
VNASVSSHFLRLISIEFRENTLIDIVRFLIEDDVRIWVACVSASLGSSTNSVNSSSNS